MGISTLQAYQGAQIFEAVGIHQKVIDKCFFRTVSRLGGLGFDEIAKEVLIRHKLAFPEKPQVKQRLGGGWSLPMEAKRRISLVQSGYNSLTSAGYTQRRLSDIQAICR